MKAVDETQSISIRAVISGLTELALMLNNYTVSTDPVERGGVVTYCHLCNKVVFSFVDLSMLELANQVLEHDAENHDGTFNP